MANGDTVVNADGCPIDRPHNGESTSHSCQLSIQGLNDEGTKSSDNQQFSLQKQHRQHWRMRTQPVTVDEVYEADKYVDAPVVVIPASIVTSVFAYSSFFV